jgi:hypothetical protein
MLCGKKRRAGKRNCGEESEKITQADELTAIKKTTHS